METLVYSTSTTSIKKGSLHIISAENLLNVHKILICFRKVFFYTPFFVSVKRCRNISGSCHFTHRQYVMSTGPSFLHPTSTKSRRRFLKRIYPERHRLSFQNKICLSIFLSLTQLPPHVLSFDWEHNFLSSSFLQEHNLLMSLSLAFFLLSLKLLES